MRPIAIIIAFFLMLSCVIFCGCNEFSNDDDKFLRKADVIIDDLYPVSKYTYDGDKASSYRIELADYTLSSKCEEIRDDLDFALDQIEFIDNMNDGIYIDHELLQSSADLVNMFLKQSRDEIDELQK